MLERSHIAGSSLQLCLVARLGLVVGGDAQVGGGEAGVGPCVGDGYLAGSGTVGTSS